MHFEPVLQERRDGCRARRRLGHAGRARRAPGPAIRMLARRDGDRARALRAARPAADERRGPTTSPACPTGAPGKRTDRGRWRARGGRANPLCVAMLDLDYFKAYNDERGHRAGDRLLKQATAAWSDELRAGDIAGPLRRGRVHGRAAGLHPGRREDRSSSDSAPRCLRAKPSRRESHAGTGASRRKSSSAVPTRLSTRPSGPAATGWSPPAARATGCSVLALDQ